MPFEKVGMRTGADEDNHIAFYSVRDAQGWKAGQEFVFLLKPEGMLVMPVPEIEDLRGIAKGANPTNYRDRRDRY